MTHFKLRVIVGHGFLESWCWYECIVQFEAMFVIVMFLKSGDNVILTQRLFRQHFEIGQRFRATVPAANKKPPGRPRTICTPDNIAALERSPTRSVRQHSQALNISDRSVRQLLHLDMKFHPYKLQEIQQLLHRDLRHVKFSVHRFWRWSTFNQIFFTISWWLTRPIFT